jgi:tetratricopeptide (TPR) repeat protein
LVTLGQLDRAATLHREALQAAREIGYEEPTRWLATEVAIDLVVVDGWKEARRIVDELIPGYETSPFWIEPQTRVCRARMLFAEGALAEALEDADRAVDLVRGSHAFQSICEPFAFRASVHAELGELEEAAALLDELLGTWIDLHSGYVGWWLLDLWAASAATGREERLQAAIDGFPVFPWLEVTTALIQRDFDSAVDRLDQIGATSRTALVRLWAGERLVEQGRQADANVHLERSRDFWRSVGAQRYVDRCSSLLAGGEIEEGSFISASDP